MPRYWYKGIDSAGKESFGIVEAEDEPAALGEVQKRGLYPTQLRIAHVSDEWRARWHKERHQKRQQEERKQKEVRDKHARQRLVVRYRDGHTEYGVCFALNAKENGFHLDLVDSTGTSIGETKAVRFSELKAVFYVKSFDGKFDKSRRYQEWTPEGSEYVVVFADEETLRGRMLHRFDPDEPRFYLIPEDSTSNNISMLIERAATQAVYTAEEYEAKRAALQEERKRGKTESAGLSQEETMGDFYFETRSYPSALEQYRIALQRNPSSQRLRKKILFATYNNGIQYIKRHEYAEALACMEIVLKSDPRNSHALKKAAQLRRIIEKEGQAGPRAPIED